MTSPDPDLGKLSPMFRALLEAWIAAAAEAVPHVEMRVTETRRTIARQQELYALGREPPHLNERKRTWTLNSRHRWGLAADLAMIRRETGEAIWSTHSWEWVYQQVPPAHFGLRHLAPTEYVHLELRWADEAISEADALNLTQS